jgi:phosphoglycolate phosphatase-like HAD superfamily hydrolase
VIYVFDLDGTLVDTVQLHAETFVEAFREAGIGVDQGDVKSLVGLSGPEIVERLGGGPGVFRRKVELFIERVGEVREFPGATEVLHELKSRGHTVCIATSSNRRMAEAILGRFKWPIDALVTADDVERGKPAPDMLLEITGRFGGRAVFVGDTDYDRQTAENAGVDAIILGQDINGLRGLL